MDRFCHSVLYRQWNLWLALRETVYRPPQQEFAWEKESSVWYYKMLCRISWSQTSSTLQKIELERYGNISFHRQIARLNVSLMFHFQTARVLQLGLTASECSFAQNFELYMTAALQRFQKMFKKFSSSDPMFNWPNTNQISISKRLTYIDFYWRWINKQTCIMVHI